MPSLRILSAGSTLHGVRACAALAARTPGVAPEVALGGAFDVATDHGHNIRDALQRGEAGADVVLLPADMIDALAAKNLLRDSVLLGTVGIGGAVRAGSRAPDIATMDALRAALIAADAVLLTRAPTGDHLLDVIATLGLADVVAAKLERFATSTRLNAALAQRSDNALGFGPETEIRAGQDVAGGVVWVGDVPDEIQIALPYAAAMLTRAREIATARAFLNFLATAPAREAFAKTGVRTEPS